MITLHKILPSALDTPELLASINIHVPQYHTCTTLPFKPPYVRCNYLQNSPLMRFQRSANMVREHIFSNTSNQIKSHYFDQLNPET